MKLHHTIVLLLSLCLVSDSSLASAFPIAAYPQRSIGASVFQTQALAQELTGSRFPETAINADHGFARVVGAERHWVDPPSSKLYTRAEQRIADEVAQLPQVQEGKGALISMDGFSGVGKSETAKGSAMHLQHRFRNIRFIVVGRDGDMKLPLWRHAHEKLVVGGSLTAEEEAQVDPGLRQKIIPGHEFTYENEFYVNSQTLTTLRKIRDFIDSPNKSWRELTILIDAYDRVKQRSFLVPLTIRRGDVVIVEGNYINEEEFKDFFDLRFRLTDTFERIKRRFFTSREGKVPPARFELLRRFYPLGIVPSQKAYAQRTRASIHREFDLNPATPANVVDEPGTLLFACHLEFRGYKIFGEVNGERTELDLTSAENYVFHLLEESVFHHSDERVHIQHDFLIGNWPVPVDAEYSNLKKVILELIKNSREAVMKTGKDSGSMYFEAKILDDMLILIGKDDGVGLQGADRNRLFTEGYSSKEDEDSQMMEIGLGLFYSRQFVENVLHGMIDLVDNATDLRQGSGATVVIQIPLKENIDAHGTPSMVKQVLYKFLGVMSVVIAMILVFSGGWILHDYSVLISWIYYLVGVVIAMIGTLFLLYPDLPIRYSKTYYSRPEANSHTSA